MTQPPSQARNIYLSAPNGMLAINFTADDDKERCMLVSRWQLASLVADGVKMLVVVVAK